MRRRWRHYPYRLLVLRNRNHDLAGMQMQPRFAEARAVTVNVVANDGPAHRGGVDAQLMGAAGDRLHLEPGESIAASQYLPIGYRGLSFRVGFLPPSAFRVEAAERHVDGALEFGWAAFDHRPVRLGNSAVLEQQPQRRRCLAMASQHQTTRSIAVEPMRQNRRTRQPEAQRVKGGFEVGSALRPAMHRQPRGLVDHQHQAVAMKHAVLDFLRAQLGNFGSWVETFAHGAKPLTHPA